MHPCPWHVQTHASDPGEGIRGRESALTLEKSRLLLLRGGGSRTIHLTFEGGAASIVGSGRAIMAVELSERVIIVDCIQGNCTVEGEGQGAISLQAGQRVSLISGDLGGVESLVEQAVSAWNELCGSCLSVP